MEPNYLDIQVVVGPDSRRAFEEVIVPHLPRSYDGNLVVHMLDYSGSGSSRERQVGPNIYVKEYPRESGSVGGFGYNHNLLFQLRKSDHPFLILNPDALPAPGSIDLLLRRFRCDQASVAIVEGSQWPFTHPKEFDDVSLETPWASGAFCLVNGSFFRNAGGFDERYFMYLEDVDLSWRAWLSGWKVLHEPQASCFHFSNGPYYREDLESLEEQMGKRNFVLLLEKHFGSAGIQCAFNILRKEFGLKKAVEVFAWVGLPDGKYRDTATEDEQWKSDERTKFALKSKKSSKLKVLGFNRFHVLKSQSDDSEVVFP